MSAEDQAAIAEEVKQNLAEIKQDFIKETLQRVSTDIAYEFSHGGDANVISTSKVKDILAERDNLRKQMNETEDESIKQELQQKYNELREQYKKEIKKSWAGATERLVDNAFANAVADERSKYHDGDKVFVEKCDAIEVGEVGIFVVNGDVYIKELGNHCLISHNEKYKPIRIGESDSVYCCGRVIGIVEE